MNKVEFLEIRVGELFNLKTIIRLMLTAALCYGVYTETGVWTTIAIVLTSVAHEMEGCLLKKIKQQLLWISIRFRTRESFDR